MKILELFCGTKSVSNAFKAAGHEVYTVDWNKDFNADLTVDIGTLSVSDVVELCGGYPDVIWASPDCTTYSVMALSRHRNKEADGRLTPKTEYAAFCDNVNTHVIQLIKELNPRFWFIENPMGCMRKMPFMEGLPRYTVTYCQYGEERQKPTDIWTNHPEPNFKPACKRGAPCHVPAPRGSATGTQGIKGARDRSRIPTLLCEHIVKICEEVSC
jgi:site-specific DNA-cytosine methylase